MPDGSVLVHGCLSALLRASVEGGAALLLVYAACRLTPRLSPVVHAWLWRLGYAKVLLALFSSWTVSLPLLPARTVGLPNRPLLARPVRAELEAPAAPVPAVTSTALPPPAAKPTPPSPVPDLPGLIVSCWLFGVLFAARAQFHRYRAIRRMRRRANPADDPRIAEWMVTLSAALGVRRQPRVLIAAGLSSPLVTGGRSPVILLPQGSLADLDHQALRLLLVHELAHLRRRDLLWAWLPAVARTLLFFHPLVWLAEREWNAATESACDQQVLALTRTEPADYARLLVRVVSHRSTLSHLPAPTALGAADSHYLVRRRLLQMKHLQPFSRRSLARWGLAVALLGLIGLIPWRVSAQTEAPDRGTRLALQWEDVLLLEATHYLQLTPTQLQKLRPLVQLAEERLSRLRTEEEGTVATLERLAKHQREALVDGRSLAPGESEQVVTLGQTLQRRREQAQNEIVQMLAPRLARILTPLQIQRAYLLTQGETLPQELKSPPLWDPKAGFILDGNTASEWRENTVKQALYQRFPPKLVDSLRPKNMVFLTINTQMLDETGASTGRMQKLMTGNVIRSYVKDREIALDTVDPAWRADANRTASPDDPARAFPPDLRRQAEDEENRLRDRLANLAQFIPSGASEEERALALQPLVRRMFLSPRMKPALNARLGSE